MGEIYGVTKDGFNPKRLDTIMEEVNADLSEGWGFDTRVSGKFLNVLNTTYCGKIAEMWEHLQDVYYSKYVATAEGVNLDNAAQYGGVRRSPAKRSTYPLHCTGTDGAVIAEGSYVSTNTNPEIKLYNPEQIIIERANCNGLTIKPAVIQNGTYTVTIDGETYSYMNAGTSEDAILTGLQAAITDRDLELSVKDGLLSIVSTSVSRVMIVSLSANLTTETVTTVGNFVTQDYGKITIPNNLITKLDTNIAGWTAVNNLIDPVYGSDAETDVEFRQSYTKRSALRSDLQTTSIESELLNNVDNLISAKCYENNSDTTDAYGLPPHSIQVIAEGGADMAIALAILRRKAPGINTYGSVTVNVPGVDGDSIPVRFSRPEFVYVWMKLVLHGSSAKTPSNYETLTKDAIMETTDGMKAGDDLLIQTLDTNIYAQVAGLTYIDFTIAYSSDQTKPADSAFKNQNVIVTGRKKVLVNTSRIEVTFDGDS